MNIRKIMLHVIKNWPAKVLSLVLAIILFVFHQMNTMETKFFLSSLKIENMSGLTPANLYPHSIRVNLKGDNATIASVFEDEIEVFVSLENIESPGTYLLPVQ